MPGLAPGIHVLVSGKEVVDGRVNPGHDEEWTHARAPIIWAATRRNSTPARCFFTAPEA